MGVGLGQQGAAHVPRGEGGKVPQMVLSRGHWVRPLRTGTGGLVIKLLITSE